MNAKLFSSILAIAVVFALSGHAQRKPGGDKLVPPGLEAQIKQFFADKKAQAQELTKQEGQPQMPEIWEFFSAGENGDWQTVASIYRNLRRGAYQYEGGRKEPRLETVVWQPVNECFGAYEDCANGEEKYVRMFAEGILRSLPKDSIYFGGTDPGRWLVTAFCKSHGKADPCFVLTQNALADGLYLKYIRMMYGDRISTPSDADSQKAFQDYIEGAGQRLKAGKLKPGENVQDVGGKMQASGQVAVMAINARIARWIFDANPRYEFFIEDSFPLDWMYPYLSPHGLIMKINRAEIKTMPEAEASKDHDYWVRLMDGVVGKWLTPESSVAELCEFATSVFLKKEMAQFKGDPKFIRNDHACKTYSKLRSSIAGVYAWRWKNVEKERMAKEADFAFRQAFALCPYSPEAVFRYTNFLIEQGRKKDARLIVETAQQLDPRNGSLGNLLDQLEEE